MNIDDFLARFIKVKPTGSNRWKTCCPTHDDQNPSLKITVDKEGVILLHCFAGCETADVLAAIGADFSDLFPDTNKPYSKLQRKQFNAVEILEHLALEVSVVAVAASQVRQGIALSDDDMERLKEADLRLHNAVRC